MEERSGASIAALASGAAGLVLLAPLLGREGWPRAADLALAGAALCGVAAFAAAAAQTVAALRRSRAAGEARAPGERGGA